MSSIEFKTTSASSLTELFINGEWKGSFMSPRKAKFYVDSLTISGTVIDVTHPLVANQKNDEPPIKRRGRPKKVGTNIQQKKK